MVVLEVVPGIVRFTLEPGLCRGVKLPRVIGLIFQALKATFAECVVPAMLRDQVLSSRSTLSRFENQANCDTAIELHRVMVDQFIVSFNQAPKRLVLDFDVTDDRVQVDQEGRELHVYYYDHYCFLP